MLIRTNFVMNKDVMGHVMLDKTVMGYTAEIASSVTIVVLVSKVLKETEV